MNKRERIAAAIQRQPVDRPPVALWRHFPGDDLDPDRFAERVVAFQRTYDFDFVKVTPAGSYSAEMYGAGLAYDDANSEGARTHVRRVVMNARDWEHVFALDHDNLVFRRERASMQKIRAALGSQVPIAQTVFTPLSIASRLAGSRFYADLRDNPAAVHRALEQITLTVQRFALDAIAAGADAMFVATQVASRQLLLPDEFRIFAQPYDLALINALRDKVDFIFLHVHGDDIYFDESAAYPVQILNWHDRRTPPDLAAGHRRCAVAVAGGVDEDETLRYGTPEQIRDQVQDAIEQTGGTGLIVATGCVTRIDTPAANLRAVRSAVEFSA